MRFLNTLSLILIIIGAINWGLVGLFNYDLVAALFGSGSALSDLIYALVGLAGIYALFGILPKEATDKDMDLKAM